MNLAKKIHETALKYDMKPAIVFENKSYSFMDIDKEVRRYAAVLKQLGIKPGDRVAFQLDKCMEFIFLHLANLSIGGITLPLNSGYQIDEVKYFLSDSGSSLYITDSGRCLNQQSML
jgi:malonyl-CoA/methylmalonyl-CoA synthetase